MATVAMAAEAQVMTTLAVRGGRGGRGRGGGGGRGRGSRGGSGRGNDHGRKRSNFRWDHVNSKGGRALDKCKLEDGSWNVDSIMDGQRDAEARRQTHITKVYYPMAVWKQREPLERRKVSLESPERKGGCRCDQPDAVCTGECKRHKR